jgi:DNA-binding CsgD family transcriptional regulator
MPRAAFVLYENIALDTSRSGAANSLRHAAMALDWLPVAVLTVDADGLILYCNRRAEAYLERACGIRESNGRLRCARSEDSARLAKSLRQLSSDACGGEPLVLTVGSINGGRPLGLLLASAVEPGNVCVFAFDPREKLGFSPMLARQLYGLSERETEVASAVVSGRTLEEIARSLGVERETVRSHLKRIFLKTQTSRQSELVRLLSTGLFGLEEAR